MIIDLISLLVSMKNDKWYIDTKHFYAIAARSRPLLKREVSESRSFSPKTYKRMQTGTMTLQTINYGRLVDG